MVLGWRMILIGLVSCLDLGKRNMWMFKNHNIQSQKNWCEWSSYDVSGPGLAWADAKQCGIWSNLLSKPISAASLATLLRWDLGLTFVAHRHHFFSRKQGLLFCVWGVGGGVIWRVHLEASSQYQFVVRVEDLRHTLQRERESRWPEILSCLSSLHQRSRTDTLHFIADPSKGIFLTSTLNL